MENNSFEYTYNAERQQEIEAPGTDDYTKNKSV